jgi:hypothetical protein
MPALPSFGDFLLATRDVKFASKETLVNEATKNTYFLTRCLKGKGVNEVFKGGTKLVEDVLANTSGNFSFYNPNQEFSPSATDTLKRIEVPWAFAQTHYVYTKETTKLNAGDPNAYVNLKKAYEMGAQTDNINGMETALWTKPNFDLMESASAETRHPYSIPAFITRDGLVPASGNGGIATDSSPWTSLQTLSPTTFPWYRNKFKSYSAADPTNPDTGIVAMFDDLTLQVQFDMPTALKKYSEQESLQKQVIATNKDGVTLYKKSLRALNDRMNDLRDPAISGPQYLGIPIDYVALLDEAGWTANQPDYFLINFNYMKPIFHEEMYMDEVLKDGGAKQPNTNVVYYFTWYNFINTSRRRQGRGYAA